MPPPIAPARSAAAPARLPASFLQEELLGAFDPASSDFGIAAVWRLTGPLDDAAMTRALAALALRHEALRTTLERGPAGAQQVIRVDPAIPVELVPVSGRRARTGFLRSLHRAIERPFDMRGGPLARATLFRLGVRDHVLVLDLHHAVADGWSMRVLLRDFHRLYAAALSARAPRPSPEPLQFGDYATWERSFRDARLEAFWRARMERRVTPLRLPGERPCDERRPFDTTPVALAPVAPSVLGGLTALGRQREVSVGAVLRTALAATLAPFARDELVLGVLHANRDRPELQATVGFVADFLPLHVDISGEPSFAELLRRTTTAWREVYAHRMPSGAIRGLAPDDEAANGSGPFGVTLNVTPHSPPPVYAHTAGDGTLQMRELIGRHMRALHPLRECAPIARLAFVCTLDARGGMSGWLAPNNAAVPPATVAAVGRRFTRTLTRASADPFRPIEMELLQRA